MTEIKFSFELQKTLEIPSAITRIQTSTDGKWVATTSFDEMLRLYDATTFNMVRTVNLRAKFTNILKFSADGTKLIAGAKSPVVFDMAPLPKDGLPSLKKIVGFQKSFKHEPKDSALDPDGNHLWSVGGADHSTKDNFLRKWDISTGELKERWDISKVKEINCEGINITDHIKISNDGLWAAVTSTYFDLDVYKYCCCVRLFDLKTGHMKWIFNKKPAQDEGANKAFHYMFSPDNKIVYVHVCEEKTYTIYKLDAATGKETGNPIIITTEKNILLHFFLEMKSNLNFIMLRLGTKTEQENITAMILDLNTEKVIWENKDMPEVTKLLFSHDEKLLYYISNAYMLLNEPKPSLINFYKLAE